MDDFAGTWSAAIRASGRLPGSIALGHGAAAGVVFATGLDAPVRMFAVAFVLLSLYLTLRDLAGTAVHGSVSAMHLDSDGTVILRRRGGASPECGRLVGAWTSGFLVVLRIRLPRPAGRWPAPRVTRIVTIARGTTSDGAFRRLRVILRGRRWAE